MVRLTGRNRGRFDEIDPFEDERWEDFLLRGEGVNPELMAWVDARIERGQPLMGRILSRVGEEIHRSCREEYAMWEDELRYEEYLWNNR